MSGVINIITKKAKRNSDKSVTISAEAGSQSYQNHSVSAAYPGVNIGFNYQHLGAQNEISRSYSKKYTYDTDATDRYSFNLNTALFDNLYFDYLGSFNKTGFQKIYDDTTKAYEETEQEHTKHFADLRFETGDFRAKMFGTYETMRRSEYTSPDPNDDNRNYNAGMEGDYRFSLAYWGFTTGASVIHHGADYSNQYGKHHRNDAALFMEVKKSFSDTLTATAGVREQMIIGESGTDDYNQFLPSFGLNYKINEQMNLFANAGKAFRAPTFNNLYYDSSFLKGNPDLEPEEGWTYESGVKYDISMLRLRFAGFYMTYDNKIKLDRSQGYPLTYFNAGRYESTGVEWELGFSPFPRTKSQTLSEGNGWGWQNDLWIYTAGYWADPTAEDTSGVEYQSGPKFQNSVGISYLTDHVVLDLNSQILRSRENNLDSYAAFNFYGRVKVWKGHVTFGVDNIFDEDVQVTGDLSDDACNLYVYEDLGSLYKVGYEITF